MKLAEDSVATALAISVLPVPGGPYRTIPLGGVIPNLSNPCGFVKGHSTVSFNFCLTSSSPPTWSHLIFGISTITSLRADGSTGETKLYNYGNLKLTTVSDGIDVSGVASTTFGVNLIDPTAAAYGGHFSYDDAESKIRIGGVTNGTKNAAITIERDTSDVTLASSLDVSGRLDVAQDIRLRGNSSTSDVGVASISVADANGSINFDAGNDGTNMSLTSTGLGIGTTSPQKALNVSADNSAPVRLERNTSDGQVIQIYKDGSAVSSIGTNSIGIGTSVPDAPLTIHNSSDPEIRFGYSASQDHRITWDSSKVFIESDPENANGNSAIGFRVDGSEKARITSTGRLGLNTTNPTTDLEVNATGANGIKITSDQPYLFFNDTDNSGTAYDATISYSGDSLYIGGASAASIIRFRNKASFGESARINTIGHFGIGNTSPQEKLTIGKKKCIKKTMEKFYVD